MTRKQMAKEIIETAQEFGSATIGWTWGDEVKETSLLEKAVWKYAEENGIEIDVHTSMVGECKVYID